MLVRSAATALLAAAALAPILFWSKAGAAEGPVATTDHVEARLVAEVEAAAPGTTVLVGLHKIIVPDWHTYWLNPGDAGEPTQLTFDAPAGVQASGFIWPIPERIRISEDLLNYGYEGELLLPLELTVPADAQPGETLSFQALAFWLVCEKICIPEEVTLTLDLPIADAAVADPTWGPTLQEQVAAAPRDLGFDAAIERVGDKVRLTVADSALADAIAAGAIRDVEFFPFAGDVIVPAAEQAVRFGEGGVELTMTPNFGLEGEMKPVDGVLAFEADRGGAWVRTGVQIAAAVGATDIGAIVATPRSFNGGAGGGAGIGLATAALFAFIGGLILNLMPCVFPVLSIKVLGVMEHAHGQRQIARRHGLAFLGGVVATFSVLAIALIALKAGGAQIGWGFQLQSAAFVTAMSVLFFLIGLNLLGVFEIGSSLQNLGGGAAAKLDGPAGSFATGALAVLAASPCTAPFMSAALPVALSSPPAEALAIFWALGLGFAAPFTILSFFPEWRRFLPKPGAWMDRLKQFFAFPMFATVAWLLWVVANQAGPNGMLAALVVIVAVSFLVWAFASTKDARPSTQALTRVAGVAAFVVVLALVGTAYGSGSLGGSATVASSGGRAGLTLTSDDEPWSEVRVAELRAEGRPVFVDFTAAWCITCQLNKRVALKTERVQDVFASTNTAQLVADWTNRNATIAAELERYNRAGVPLYLLFPPEGDVIVLNELLTEQQVISALERAAAPAI